MRKPYLLLALTVLACSACSDGKTVDTFQETDQLHESITADNGILDQRIELELDLADSLDDADIVRLGRDYGLSIRPNSPLAHEDGNIELASFNSTSELQVEALLRQLNKDPRVEAAEPVIEAHVLWTPNDPMLKDQWGMKKVKAEDAWERTCGQGVNVAIVDTGVSCGLSDFKGSNCSYGYDFVAGTLPTKDNDSNGHGSHVGSTVNSSTNNGLGVAGLAHCVKLQGIRVLGTNGSGTMAGVSEGVIWASKHGAQVINMSLGSSQRSSLVDHAVKYANDHGTMVVAAAGNAARKLEGSPSLSPGSWAISATTSDDQLASFSSFSSPEKSVLLGSPGHKILQQTIGDGDNGSFKEFSGTSMSCPFAVSAAALVMSQGITHPDSVAKILQSSAIQKNDPVSFGAGILDAGSATKLAFYSHLIPRSIALLGFLFLIPFLIKRDKATPETHWLLYPTALFSSIGLFFFLPLTGLLPHMGSLRWLGEMLCRPLPEMYLPFSVSIHKYLPLANALLPFGLVMVGYHSRLMRILTGGLSIGIASYLGQVMYSSDITFALGGSWGLRVWCGLNIALCLWAAKKTLTKDSDK